MRNSTYISVKHMGPGEWVGQYMRRMVRAGEDRPAVVASAPTDWRFDWTSKPENRREFREFRFE